MFQFFAITSSDGLFDVLAPEKVAAYLGRSLFEETVPLLEACERLIREASRLWMKANTGIQYRDDISVGVSRIDFVEST